MAPCAVAAVGVEFCFERTAREPESRARARQVDERPAMTQEHRESDQPWVLAGGYAGERTDESIEFVRDVEFVEEGGDEPTRPLHTVGTVREFLKEIVAVVLSEVLDLDALRRPGAGLVGRDSSASGSVAHGRHLRQSAWLWERRRPPCATACREGRVDGRGVAPASAVLWEPRAEP